MNADRLGKLLGLRDGGRLVLVTPRGVFLPLKDAHRDWTLEQLNRLLMEIDQLPETRP